MNFPVLSLGLLRPPLAGALAALSWLALAGCETSSVPVPDAGRDYYPLEAGTYRIYNVTDSTFRNSILLPVVRYQVRESIAANDGFTDAAGSRSYRVVRAKRTPPASMEWQADSVYVLTATPQTVSLVRNNRRTVELIFPVRAERTWNMNAFSNFGGDTITNQNRGFRAVGQAFSTSTTVNNMPVSKNYEQTVTVDDKGDIYTADNECAWRSYRQVFARGVGPVLRYRRNFGYEGIGSNAGSCLRSQGRPVYGTSRHEVLVEYGR